MHKSNTNGLSEGLVALSRKLNSFLQKDSSQCRCLKFIVCDKIVGFVRDDVVKELRKFPSVFVISDKSVKLAPDLQTNESRNTKVAYVLNELRQQDTLSSLQGWRDENYDVKRSWLEEPFLQIERAATCLFGTIQYGVHLNAYTYNSSGQKLMWIGQRSKTKATYPGLLDNMCAGGLSVGLGIRECLEKECQEEASVQPDILKKIISVGTVSYIFEDERGVFPESLFVFDVEVPPDFKPVNADGEVAGFRLLPLSKLKHLITTDEFKPSCALVILDFMIRHGIITADEEPNYSYLVEQMHVPLQTLFDETL